MTLAAIACVSGAVINGAQQPAAKSSAAKTVAKPTGTLAQIMRGIYFPNSNLIFDVQQTEPAAPRTAPAGAGTATR